MGEVSARDRFRGCLVGPAAGDALGTTLEFSAPGSFDPTDPRSAGNGSLMRLAPVPMFFAGDAREAVLWAFFHTEDFRQGALDVVNLGDDADTTGAIFGQIAGAHYGVESIPAEWRRRLTMATEITSIADRLHERITRS